MSNEGIMAHFNHVEQIMKGTKFIFASLLLLLYASLLPGCGGSEPAPQAGKNNRALTSSAPVATDHEAFAQLVEQAGEHWRDMASEVADRVLKAYNDRDDILERPVYLPPPNNRPFTVAFYNLLRTELVSRGLQVSYKQEPRSVVLEYTVQTVPFDPSRRDTSGRFASARASDSEIIVNARMFYRNRFVMHHSAVRYINQDDIELYFDPQDFDPLASSTQNIRITRK